MKEHDFQLNRHQTLTYGSVTVSAILGFLRQQVDIRQVERTNLIATGVVPTFPRPHQPIVVLLGLHHAFQVGRQRVTRPARVGFANLGSRVDPLHLAVQGRDFLHILVVLADRARSQSVEDPSEIIIGRMPHVLVEFLGNGKYHTGERRSLDTLSGFRVLIFDGDIRIVVPTENSSDLRKRK